MKIEVETLNFNLFADPQTHGWIFDGNFSQMLIQLYDVLGTFIWSGLGTFIILKVIDMTMGLRVSKEVEIEGLDFNLHGETVQ